MGLLGLIPRRFAHFHLQWRAPGSWESAAHGRDARVTSGETPALSPREHPELLWLGRVGIIFPMWGRFLLPIIAFCADRAGTNSKLGRNLPRRSTRGFLQLIRTHILPVKSDSQGGTWLRAPAQPTLAADAVHVWRVALDEAGERLGVLAQLLSRRAAKGLPLSLSTRPGSLRCGKGNTESHPRPIPCCFP